MRPLYSRESLGLSNTGMSNSDQNSGLSNSGESSKSDPVMSPQSAEADVVSDRSEVDPLLASSDSPLGHVRFDRLRALGQSDAAIGEPQEGESPSVFRSEVRPFRYETLRDQLDEEFSRNYRFEGISDLFHDLKGFLRNVMDREDENLADVFPAHSIDRRVKQPRR